MLSKLTNDFLKEYLKSEPYATHDELIEIISQVELLIRHNKDKSLSEIIDLIIADNINDFEDVRKKYGVPGYTASIKVLGIDVKLYGGNINYLGEELPENALFDIASMTKFYTQIICYNLIRDGVFRRSDRIYDLDNRFVNLKNITIDNLLTFGVTFKTNGLIRDKKYLDEALDTLFKVNVIENGRWNYNDIGLMIMKEVMEKLTGKTYLELLDKYVIKPLHLTDTHIIVPRNKYHLITGTPNFREGRVNDMTANAVGGYSGHAGIFASSDDLVKLMMGVRNNDILPNMEDTYNPGKLNDAIAVMGNVYTANRLGLEKSFVDVLEPRDTFAIAGSTRVNAASSSDATYNVLFNPSSMSIDEAKEKNARINEERQKQGLKTIDLVKEFEFDCKGKLIKYTLIDSRQFLPIDRMAETVKKVALTILKLRFLNFAISKYDDSVKKINITKKSNIK